MLDNLYITCSKSKIEIKEKNPYINLLLDIYEGETCIPSKSFDYIDSTLTDLLDELSSREEKILRLKYGFDDSQLKEDAIAKILNISSKEVIEIEHTALNKLRHPSHLNKIKSSLFYKSLRYQTLHYNSYCENILRILKEDIENYSINKDFDTMYLQHILNRYNSKDKMQSNQTCSFTIEDMDFSVRTCNCLRRKGLYTLLDILMYDEHITEIRNLGRKSSSEIFNKLLNLCGEKIESFPFIQNLDDSFRELYEKEKRNTITATFPEVELILPKENKTYEELNIDTICNSVKSLFDIDFSPSLINVLLMHGYFDVKEIFDNSDRIFAILTTHNYSKEAKELYCILKDISEFTLIGNLDLDVFNFIYQNNINTFEALKSKSFSAPDVVKKKINTIDFKINSNKISNINHINFINNNHEKEETSTEDIDDDSGFDFDLEFDDFDDE